MTRTTRTLAAAVAATATLGLAAALTTAPAQAAPTPSKFGLRGWAYGSGVIGGPVKSAATGFESIGCTTRTGVVRTNHQAAVAVPGLGTIKGLDSRVWTTRSGKTVSTWSRNNLGSVTLSDSPLGSIILTAVSATARAYHDGSRFRTSTDVQVAKLQMRGPVGPPITLQLPKPNRPVTVPGIGKVEIAPTINKTGAHSAQAVSNGLKVTLSATKSVVKVAHAVSEINDQAVTGIFRGRSYAVGGTAAGNVVNLGRNPLIKMPCAGTAGEQQARSLVSTAPGGGIAVGAATSGQFGKTTARHAWGYERAQVASIVLSSSVKITGIVGQVNVSRTGKKLERLKVGTRGTQVGTLVLNGQTQSLPERPLTIPGVAKLQPRVVTKLPNGLKLTALRITLLNGSGAVIDLGNAELAIRRTR